VERIIDRKEYRRNIESSTIVQEEQVDIWQKRIRKFLLQTMGVSVILLTISFFRFFHCNEILIQIDNLLTQEITVSSIQKSGQRIFDRAVGYYAKLNNWISNMFIAENDFQHLLKKSGDTNLLNLEQLSANQEKNKIGDAEDIISSSIDNFVQMNEAEKSGDSEATNYELAVEGMNQMLEDEKYIKENYEMTIPVIGTITSEFGVRNSNNPIVSHYHSGLDIAANTGTQILAALDGEVIEATTDTYYGKYLKVQKDDVIMIYAHCSKLLVKVGDKVKKGELIAYVGNTGNSTGPHLHFELKYQDRLVDPKNILEL